MMDQAERLVRRVLRLNPAPEPEVIELTPFAREARQKRLASIQRERARRQTGNIVEETIFVTVPAMQREERG